MRIKNGIRQNCISHSLGKFIDWGYFSNRGGRKGRYYRWSYRFNYQLQIQLPIPYYPNWCHWCASPIRLSLWNLRYLQKQGLVLSDNGTFYVEMKLHRMKSLNFKTRTTGWLPSIPWVYSIFKSLIVLSTGGGPLLPSLWIHTMMPLYDGSIQGSTIRYQLRSAP